MPLPTSTTNPYRAFPMATDDPHLRVLIRAGVSLLILVFGIGVAIIPSAGTLSVVFLGWVPLIAWSILNLKGRRCSRRVSGCTVGLA